LPHRSAASAELLRASLVDQLRELGAIGSDRVADAFRTVPRYLFTPSAPLEAAYANDVVITKRDRRGVALSSVSAPQNQALML